MKIDIGTLNLVMVLFAIIQASVLLFQYRLNKPFQGLDWWAVGSLAGATGFALNFLRDVDFLRPWIIIIGNTLLVATLVFFYFGIMSFFSHHKKQRAMFVFLAGFVGVLWYYTLVNDDISIRVAVISAVVALISFLNAGFLLREKVSSAADPIFVTAAAFIIHGVFFAFRSADMVLMGGGHSYFAPTMMQITMFMIIFFCNNLWTFGFISIVNQRLHNDMKESKERFELVFNASPDAAVLSRLEDGRIVDVNEGFLSLTGFTRLDIVGKITAEMNLWKDAKDRRNITAKLREQGFCENVESVFQRRDGSEVLGLVSAKITNLQGVPHIISITRDISARRQAENEVRRSEALYSSILAASPDGIAITDPEGRFCMVSPRALAIFGFESAEKLLGQDVWSVIDTEDRERARTNIGLMFQGVFTGPAEYQGIGANGRIVDIEANAEFVRDVDGNPTNIVIIIREISERKLAETERRHNIAVQVVLKEIAEAALLSTTLDDLYGKVHQWVKQVLPAKNFYIALLEEAAAEIVFPYCVDETRTLPERRPVGKGLTEYVLRQGKVVHVTLEEFDKLCEAGVIELRYGNITKEWLGAPLIDAKGKAFGVVALNLIDEDQFIESVDIEVLSIIASQISIAINRRHLEEELKRQAMTDGLTGILNRRYFLVRAEEELRRVQRYEGECTMMILDIDHFKSVNDNFGHATGDAVLCRVVSICTSVLRDTDLLGRIGGEEFAVLLMESNAANSLPVAERLRQNIQEALFFAEQDVRVPLSVSVGIAGNSVQGESVAKMMKRADMALYQAKAEGRNKVVVFGNNGLLS